MSGTGSSSSSSRRVDLTALEAPTDLTTALERIKLLVEEVQRKEKEIKKLQKANGGTIKAIKELKSYKEENEKKLEREKLKEDIKKECMRTYEEREETRKRIWRDEQEMRDYYTMAGTTTKRFRQDF